MQAEAHTIRSLGGGEAPAPDMDRTSSPPEWQIAGNPRLLNEKSRSFMSSNGAIDFTRLPAQDRVGPPSTTPSFRFQAPLHLWLWQGASGSGWMHGNFGRITPALP